ncbi:MAG: hypothetical protein QXU11_04515 [Thermoproteota archaeon]
MELVSKRYFKVCHDAIRKHDPNHLILGCRFVFRPPDEVLKGALDTLMLFQSTTTGGSPLGGLEGYKPSNRPSSDDH